MPEISVLMPVRDGARWIGASIESVLSQTFADFELIIVDDGSRDTTPAIVAGLASRDRRIVALTQPPGGLVAALNHGLAAARAPLLARLDADDLAAPTRLREQFDAMTRNPQLVLLGSWASEIDEHGAPCGHRHPPVNGKRLTGALHRTNPMIHSTVMLRTATVREIGGYRATFSAAEDIDLWLRLSERGEVANLPRELVAYRVHATSVTARKALVQMLSARLAQRSATLRCAGQPDPADGLEAGFDLWAEPPPAYREDVAIYRVLAWVNPDGIPAAARGAVPDFRLLATATLTQRERTVAQQALLRYIDVRPDAPRAMLMRRVIALRPGRALPLLLRRALGLSSNTSFD